MMLTVKHLQLSLISALNNPEKVDIPLDKPNHSKASQEKGYIS